MIPVQNQLLLQQSDALYERYGKPLEKTQRGRYVAISKEGKTLIADTVFDLMQEQDMGQPVLVSRNDGLVGYTDQSSPKSRASGTILSSVVWIMTKCEEKLLQN